MANRIDSQKLCSTCQEKICTPFHTNFQRAQKLGLEILQKEYTSYMIDNYKNIQFQQTKDYAIRTDKFCYTDFELHHSILKEFASIVNSYKGFPCRTVYSGEYFEKVNLENHEEFDITSFEDYCLDGDMGDEEKTHYESPGIDVFICTFWPFYRILRVPFLLHVLENLQNKFGPVEILYEKYYSLSPEMAGHSLFPVWVCDKRYPTLVFQGCNLRLCLMVVSCQAFMCADTWQDTADILSLHLPDDCDGFVSPDLKNYYDVTSVTLPAKAKYGVGDDFRLFWKGIRDIKYLKFLGAVIFLFVKKSRIGSSSEMMEEFFSGFTSPLMQWVILTKVSCGGDNHEHEIKNSQDAFIDLTKCKNDLVTFMEKSEQKFRSPNRVVYQLSPEIRFYINSSSNYGENKTDIQFQWILYNCNVECPRSDDSWVNHKAILESSEKWHDSLEGCFRDFYKTLIRSEGNPKASESGELVIFVSNDMF